MQGRDMHVLGHDAGEKSGRTGDLDRNLETCSVDTAGAGHTAVDAGDTGLGGERGSPVTYPEGLRQQGDKAPRSVAKSTRRAGVVRSRRPTSLRPLHPQTTPAPAIPVVPGQRVVVSNETADKSDPWAS